MDFFHDSKFFKNYFKCSQPLFIGIPDSTKLPEVESRTQGSRPRSRTQKIIRGQGLPFRAQPSRGQGQECSRPRTKDTAASVLPKKGLQNSFSGDLQFIGVPRIFDWGRPKPQITCYNLIKNFQKRKFLWDKDIVGWKI